MSFVYQVLIRLAAPLVLLLTALRGLRDRSYWDRIPERLGFTRVRFSQAPIWVHAVSVGEVQAAAPLVRRLLNNRAQRPVLMTTTTPTGAARVRALFGQYLLAGQHDARLQHAFLPYDTPGSVRRFIGSIRPHCLIIMETELWPNLLRACQAHKVPVVLGSARISLRTAGRYQKLRKLFSRSMSNVFIGAQTEIDAARFMTLGALQTQTQVTGNIKFDIELDGALAEQGQRLRQGWQARPVWIAGSTHAGEEEQVLAAHQRVLASEPETLLILAPRHPQRFQSVVQVVKNSGFRFVTRSGGEPLQRHHQVLLLDTLGELNLFYAASDVVFVGGSLVPVGGHNLLEPASFRLPILTGPHVFNAPDIAARLAEHAALRYVYSADELAEAVLGLLTHPEQRVRQGQAAWDVLAESRGAMQRLLSLIERVTGVTV